jgi:hypothetical protein
MLHVVPFAEHRLWSKLTPLDEETRATERLLQTARGTLSDRIGWQAMTARPSERSGDGPEE